jgi:hypothetical protein
MGVRMEQTVLRSCVLCFFMLGSLVAAAWAEQDEGLKLVLAVLALIPIWMVADLLRGIRWYDDDIS